MTPQDPRFRWLVAVSAALTLLVVLAAGFAWGSSWASGKADNQLSACRDALDMTAHHQMLGISSQALLFDAWRAEATGGDSSSANAGIDQNNLIIAEDQDELNRLRHVCYF